MTIGNALLAPALHEVLVERDDARAELARAQAGVTVAVPCYHQSEYLGGCLESIAAQTTPAFETLVIDDGSEKIESVKISEICREFPDTRHVKVTNRKLPGARNTALMLTRTFAFLPLDADDWLDPAYIEKTLPLLADADVIVPGLQEHGPTRNGTFMPGFDRPLEQVDVDLMWNGFNRTYYASLFRTQVLREVGGYNGLMVDGFEDYDLALDLMQRGYRYRACEEVLFNYRTRPDGMLATAMAKQVSIRAEMSRHHRDLK
jgi:cellulose synthase/poly-beta-1,6-N-acetylglucosamine synthase-like glycosyltransferase